MPRAPSLRILNGGRDQLLEEMLSHMFRYVTGGPEEERDRLLEIDATLSRRGDLREVRAPLPAPSGPASAHGSPETSD